MIEPVIEDLSLRTNNPYSIGVIFSYDEGDFSLEREPINPPKSIGDQYHPVVDGDTLSTLAYKYYQDSKYWWVIADVNVLDWTFELEVGTILMIPDIYQIKLLT